VSVATTLRKLAKQRRAIALPRLQHLLHWSTWHALRPMSGVPWTAHAEAEAISRITRSICDLANRGAFIYFGIMSALDLGPLPIALRYIDLEGSVALEVEPVADVILRGGARGLGWLASGELSIDDLSR